MFHPGDIDTNRMLEQLNEISCVSNSSDLGVNRSTFNPAFLSRYLLLRIG